MMQFINPAVLYGLVAVAVPVIIHLINIQRYKKVYFTQTKLIATLQEQNKKRSDLRHWLILLMRMLVIAMLVMAFAGPFLPGGQAGGDPASRVSVYLDNSYSMQAEPSGSILLNEAKNKAVALAESYDPSTKFQLLTNDMSGAQQRFISRDQLISQVEETTLSPRFRSLSEILDRQHELIHNTDSDQGDVFWISDFQQQNFDLTASLLDSSLSYYSLPVGAAETPNAFIDSLWFDSPVLFVDQSAELNLRLKKHGEINTLPVKLFVNGQQRMALNADYQGQDQKDITFTLDIKTAGLHACRIEITDQSLDFDNTFFFSFYVPEEIRLLVIGNQKNDNPYLSAYFKTDTLVNVDFVNYQQIDYQSFSAYNAVILDQLSSIPTGLKESLQNFVSTGKSLIVFPSLDSDRESYNNFLNFTGMQMNEKRNKKRRVEGIQWESDFFDGIFITQPENPDYPVVFEDYALTYKMRGTVEELIQIEDGSPFLLRAPYEQGRVYFFSVASNEESSNFVAHALFSVLYKMIFEGVETEQLYFNLGEQNQYKNNSITLHQDEVPVLKEQNGNGEFIPEIISRDQGVRFLASSQQQRSGFWDLVVRDTVHDILAYNYDGRESDTRLLNMDQMPGAIRIIEQSADQMAVDMKSEREGRQLWPWFLMAALLFLLLEVVLLRIWKL
ncbi:MAG: BatA domain-containing protein [Bacteroidales bacterium]